MNAHPIVGSESCSLAKECKRLYDDEVRFNGIKEHSKHKKGEDTQVSKTHLITYKIRTMLRWWG